MFQEVALTATKKQSPRRSWHKNTSSAGIKKSSATVGFPGKVGSPGDTALIYIVVLMNHRQLHLEILFIGIPCRTDECVHIAVLCFPAEDFFCKV